MTKPVLMSADAGAEYMEVGAAPARWGGRGPGDAVLLPHGGLPKPVDVQTHHTLPDFIRNRGGVSLRPGDGIIHWWLNRMLVVECGRR